MKQIRKLLALVLALAMCMSFFSVNVWAEEKEPQAEPETTSAEMTGADIESVQSVEEISGEESTQEKNVAEESALEEEKSEENSKEDPTSEEKKSPEAEAVSSLPSGEAKESAADQEETVDEDEIGGSLLDETRSQLQVQQDYTANVNYSYSSGVTAGTVRYISQVTSGPHYHSEYWGNWGSQASIECGTASISMALSYIGINKTPKNILDEGNGITVFGKNWGGVQYNTPSIGNAINNFTDGQGKYSPPIIHLNSYCNDGHYLLIIGRNGSSLTTLDPWECSVSSMSISGNTVTYSKADGSRSEVITEVYQYYNASFPSPSIKPTISGASFPGTLTVGSVFSIKGTISCGQSLTNVTAAVYDVNGNMKTGKSVNPGSTSYDIKNLDYAVYFNNLSPGVYTYKVSATNSSGTTEESKVFIVLANADTVKPGNYKIRPSSAKGNYLDAENHNPDSGANVCLTSTEKSNYQTFAIASAGGGYYTIKNRGSGKYLDVSNASSASSTNVHLWSKNSSNAQLWQILPTGSGYCFVPKCAIENCMDVKDGNLSNGSNIQTYTANLTPAQRFSLIEYKSSIQASCTSLEVGKNRTATFTATYQTKSASSVRFEYSYTKSAIKVSAGKWNNHEKKITVKGKKAGNTTLTIKLVNSKTKKVLATKQIPITVTSGGFW